MYKQLGRYGGYFYEPYCDKCNDEIVTEYYFKKDGKMYCEECFTAMVLNEINDNLPEDIKAYNGDFDLLTEYDCSDVRGFEEFNNIMFEYKTWFEDEH